MPAENMALAESVANSVNGLSLPVKCTFAPSDAEGSLSFSLHASGLRLGRDDASVQFVRSIPAILSITSRISRSDDPME